MKKDKNTRLCNLLKQIISQYVSIEANSFPLITITRVELSGKSHRAIVFFTTIPNEKENDALIFMKRQGSKVRNFLKKNASLKHIPHLDFMIDAGERHRQHIDKLIQENN